MAKDFENIVPDMGDETSEVFAGRVEKQSLVEIYAESADFFANTIKARLDPKDGPYSLADLGSFKGELLRDILEKLPEYKINPIVIDLNENALRENLVGRHAIVANLEKIPLMDQSVDIAVVRYVLQWNDFQKQKEIIREILRVVKKFAIIQHAGSPSDNSEEWRLRVDGMLGGIQKIGKQGRFYSSRAELEQFMEEEGISFERLQDRVVKDLSDVYISLYNLDDIESEKVKTGLGEKDYVVQTSWILHPKP